MNDKGAESQADNAQANTGPRRSRRLLLGGFFGLVLVVVTAAAAAPAILSTSVGRGWVESAINGAIRGRVKIESLSLNWLSGQRIDGFALLDPAGETVLRLESLSTELSLLQAVRQELNLGRTELSGLSGDITVDAVGGNNLARALEPTEPSTDASSAPLVIPITGNFELGPARISVAAPGMDTVLFEPLTAMVRMAAADQPVHMDLRGQSRQGELTGEFSMAGQVRGLIAADGSLRPDQAQGEMLADVRDLPVDGIDRMLGLNGTLTAALGERATLKLNLSGSAAQQAIAAIGSAPNATLEINGKLEQERFALSEPATLRLAVTPALFNALTEADSAAGLRLREAFGLVVVFDRLALPVAGFNPGAVSVGLRIDADKAIQLTGAPDLGEITLRGLKASVDSERLAERLAFELRGEAITQGKPGRFDVRGELSELFDAQGTVQLDKLRLNAEAGLRDLPTAVVDRLAGQEGLLIDFLGSKINLDLTAKSSGDRIDATLDVDAGSFKAQKVSLSMRDDIALSAPATLSYTLSPDLVRRILGKDHTLALKRPAAMTLEIKKFSAPRPKAGEAFLQPGRTSLEAGLTSEPLSLSGLADLGTVNIADLRLELAADTLRALKLKLAANVSETGGGLLTDLGASPLKLGLETTTGVADDLQLAPVAAGLQLTSNGLSALAKASLPGDFSSATLTEPADIRVLLTPDLLRRFGAAQPGQPTLAKPATIGLRLSTLKLPLTPFALDALEAKLTAKVDEVAVGGVESVKGVALREANLSVDYIGPQAAVATKLSAQTSIAGRQQPGAMNVDAKLARIIRNGELNFAAAAIDGSAKISDLPSALIEALSGQSGLAALLGEVVNVTAKASSSGGDKPSVDMELQSEAANFTADLGVRLGDDLTLTRPGKLRLTLTPVGYAVLTGSTSGPGGKNASGATLALGENAVIEGSIDKLQWPLATPSGGAVFDPARATVEGSFAAARLALRDPQTKQSVTIDSLAASIKGPRLDRPIDLELTGQVRGSASAGPPGKLNLTAKAADLFTQGGEINTAGLTIDVNGQMQKFPVALADQLLDMGGLTTATLGPSADITLESRLLKMRGPIGLSVRSDYASGTIKAEMRDQAIVLTEAVKAEVRVTPELGKQVLSSIHPIFETTESGEQPVRLEIPPENVRIPTKDFDISKIVMPRIKLDVGKINLKSGWLLKGVIGLAQQFGTLEGAGRDQWTAWFTPALLQLRDGRISYDSRMDLLLDQRLHLATWGIADIGRDRADMILAFMPDTLESVFRLPTASNDALRMPLTGPLSGPSMDFKKAAVELGRLRAQKSVTRRDPLAGALLGALASKTTGTGGAIPAPSVEPLPWGRLPKPADQAGSPAQNPETSPQPAQAAPPPEPAAEPKSAKEQAIEGLINILRKPK